MKTTNRSTRRVTLVVTLSMSVLTFACGGKTIDVVAPDGESPELQQVLSFVENQIATCSIPGGAIAVVQNGGIIDQAGFGTRDDAGTPTDPATLFLMAALSKMVVGATALRLVEEGKLDTTKPITEYVPLTLASGFDPSSITIDQLLANTSGLPDVDVSTLTCPVGAGELGAWFAGNADEPLWTPPGSVWNYSQRGYAALGWVIETVASQPFEGAVAERVFGPAGMTTATYDPAVVMASGDFALGHPIDPTDGHVSTDVPGKTDCAASRPPDGVYASVLDYAHLAETLLAGGGTMLSRASVQTFETGHATDYLFPGDEFADGLYVHEGYKGLHMLRVSGDLHGYDAAVYLVPDQQFAVVIFFNGHNTAKECSLDKAAELAVDTYLGLAGIAGPDWTTSPSAWLPYTGTYVDPYNLGTITVGIDGNDLTATTSAYGTVTLTQSSASAFTGTFGSEIETVTFDPDASGPAAWFVTRLGVGARQ